MTRVKICGLRSIEHALAAAEAGADFLGIVFEPQSRRCVSIEEAKRLVQSFRERWPREGPLWVGVFANQPVEVVNHILAYCGLDVAQLSGSESLDYCRQVVRPVVKVTHVRSDAPAHEVIQEVGPSLSTYKGQGHMCMLDTFKQGARGGTGQAFNWDVAQALARDHAFLLAGGLTPENVSEAIEQVRPWGVDVSSGVETNGKKDAAKISAFISRVRVTDEALG
ncbi:MAG: phosphoribosylanthranilate isomerase [Chloroflexi bacterium]|nr:phosphoribosylanthranilate isomerase [Chloroflexota bacterium]